MSSDRTMSNDDNRTMSNDDDVSCVTYFADIVKTVILWIFIWIVLVQIDSYIIIGLSFKYLHINNDHYNNWNNQLILYSKQVSENYAGRLQIMDINNCVYKNYHIQLNAGNNNCFCDIYADLCINQTNICSNNIKIICGGDFTNCDALSKIDLNNSTLFQNNRYIEKCYYDPNRELLSINRSVLTDFYNDPSKPLEPAFDNIKFPITSIFISCLVIIAWIIITYNFTKNYNYTFIISGCLVTIIIKFAVLIYLIIYVSVMLKSKQIKN